MIAFKGVILLNANNDHLVAEAFSQHDCRYRPLLGLYLAFGLC